MSEYHYTQPALVSIGEAAKITSLSRSAINKYRKAGSFPRDVRLGERRIAFLRSEVEDWVMARIAERDGAV